jgi:hypothetical protein
MHPGYNLKDRQCTRDGDRTFIEWPVILDAAPGEDEAWHELFMSWIPEWTDSLRRTLGPGGVFRSPREPIEFPARQRKPF